MTNPALKSVSSAYCIRPETAAKIINDHNPYQGELSFDTPCAARVSRTDGGLAPSAKTAPRTDGGLVGGGALSLTTHKSDDFQKAFSRGPLISSLRPDKYTANVIPTFNINGQVISTPADFARTMLALRSPYNESLKLSDSGDLLRPRTAPEAPRLPLEQRWWAYRRQKLTDRIDMHSEHVKVLQPAAEHALSLVERLAFHCQTAGVGAVWPG